MGKGLGQKYLYEDFDAIREIDEFNIKLPSPPKEKSIDGYKLKKHLQKFTPPDILYIKELSWKMSNKIALTKEDRDFIDTQWERRINGYWFYNNGYLEYITGLHYYYLTAWNIIRVEPFIRRDGSMGKKKVAGLPYFTDSDRDYFYIWNDCSEDTNCFGLIHITNRRDGKTFRSTATVNELISRSPDSIGGIQSKTDTDGAKVFKKLIKSWKRLPEYFKPVDVGDSDPVKKLEYKNPKTRSTKTQKKEYSQVLESEITYGNAKEGYYDGDGLAIIFHDEIGKTDPKDANVWVRWDTVKECLADGADVTGKGLLTTTVEDMEKKGGIHCKRIWDESTTTSETFKKTKQTESGLKRYFKPAMYGLRGSDSSEDDEDDKTPNFIDEYGYSDLDAAEKYLIKIEKTISGEKLISRRRKYPRTIKDAFILSGKTETFPIHKIYEQLDYNETLPESLVRRGNLAFDNTKEHCVKFHDDKEGLFHIAWMPNQDDRCKFSYDNHGFPVPSNTHVGEFGSDPFDHAKTVSKKKSDAATTGFKKFDINDPFNSNGWVVLYVGRRENPDDFYEDMIMCCVFYGWQILAENNKPGLRNHFFRRGYKRYIKTTQQKDYTNSKSNTRVDGVAMSGNQVREQGVNNLTTHIYKFIGKISKEVQVEEFGWAEKDLRDDLYGNCPFNSLLNSWLVFDVNKWTDYDETVASIVTMLSVTPVREKRIVSDEVSSKISLGGLFKTYKL